MDAGATAQKTGESQGIEYTPEITGVPDDNLLDLLKSAAQLFVLQDRRPASVIALERRTQNDLERLREVLRSEGYYDAALSYRVATDERPIKVTIEVEPGTRYKLAAFAIDYAPQAPEETARPKPADIGIKPDKAGVLGAARGDCDIQPIRLGDVRRAREHASAALCPIALVGGQLGLERFQLGQDPNHFVARPDLQLFVSHIRLSSAALRCVDPLRLGEPDRTVNTFRNDL